MSASLSVRYASVASCMWVCWPLCDDWGEVREGGQWRSLPWWWCGRGRGMQLPKGSQPVQPKLEPLALRQGVQLPGRGGVNGRTQQQSHLMHTCLGLAVGPSKTVVVSMVTGSLVSLPPNMAASWLSWLPSPFSCSVVKAYQEHSRDTYSNCHWRRRMV